MYSTVLRLQNEFEVQLSIIVKQLRKPEKDQKMEDNACSPGDLCKKFEESFFSIMTVADDHISEKQLGNHADETIIEINSARRISTNILPLEKLSIPPFKGDPRQYMDFRNWFDTVVRKLSTGC